MVSPLRLPVGYRVPVRAASGRSPRHEHNDVSDIRETLDQFDRRLGELRRQIAAIAEDRQPASAPIPPPARWLHAVGPASPEQHDPGLLITQIQELTAVRDQLLAGTRELVRAYERQLDALEHVTGPVLQNVGDPVSASIEPLAPPESEHRS